MKRIIKKCAELLFSQRNPLRRLADICVTNAFHFLYYHSSETYQWNTFLGYPIAQSPMDLQVYQEVIAAAKPGFIVQTGVLYGGSVLFFASMLDLIGAPPESLVVGIDVVLTPKAKALRHPRVRLIEGSSTDPEVIERASALLPGDRGMVVLDSDHSRGHVAAELALYRNLVGVGQYLVVEDTNINGHPVKPFWGPGPREAAREFLKGNPAFVEDTKCWRHTRFTFHGWLLRER